ncbi:MAG: NUDIX hydrolase [Candidatus Acidiferrales bacterium]|jgi:ADP-ribose pyrophosphatase YjhB (NUDIX family)
MNRSREFPERPIVGVGGAVIEDDRAVLVRRGSEPLKGQWSIPGGTLEVGETLAEGVARELLEETGLKVRVLDLIEVFERIFPEDEQAGAQTGEPAPRPRYHFVVIDYLCERTAGELRAGSDVTDVALVREDELSNYHLTEAATRVLRKAYRMARARRR